MLNLDISQLTPVSTMNPRSQYDLRISLKTGKLTLSQSVITRLGLQNHGLTMYAPQEGQIIVSVQNEADSVFFTGREGAKSKTPTFTASALFNALKTTGSEEFNFVVAGENAGVRYFVLEPQGNDSADEQAPSIVDSSYDEPIADVMPESINDSFDVIHDEFALDN